MSINSLATIHFYFERITSRTQRRKDMEKEDQTVSRAPFEILEAAAPLKHAFVVEAKKAVVPNHDVIEDAHAHDVPDFF